MWILPLLGYVGVILGFGFLTLAIGTYHQLPSQQPTAKCTNTH
jgi:hypothetical protein